MSPKTLKVGIVCEGQRGCADHQVFPHLIKLICPKATWDIVPSGSRPKVLRNAPIEAKKMLETGCDVVFILWDVFPEWPDQGGSTDCKEHCKTLDANLLAANLADKRIIPVAIHKALEAWLLCDADALTEVIGVMPSKRPIKHETRPDKVSNPKTELKELFKRGRGKTYNDSFSAGQIAARLTSTKRLKKSQSFSRFENCLKRLCDGGATHC
jgi:hypothetical protein